MAEARCPVLILDGASMTDSSALVETDPELSLLEDDHRSRSQRRRFLECVALIQIAGLWEHYGSWSSNRLWTTHSVLGERISRLLCANKILLAVPSMFASVYDPTVEFFGSDCRAAP